MIREQGLTQASRLENIDQVNAEVVRLRGMLEVLQFQVDGLRAEQETYLIDQERRQLYDEARLNQLEQFLGIDSPERPTVVGDEEGAQIPGFVACKGSMCIPATQRCLAVASISTQTGSAAGGQELTVAGTGFTSSTTVRVGDTPCVVSAWDFSVAIEFG